jgi:hypothetical protein
MGLPHMRRPFFQELLGGSVRGEKAKDYVVLCPGSIPSENATKGISHQEHARHEPLFFVCE